MKKIRWERESTFYFAKCCGVTMQFCYEHRSCDWSCSLTPGAWVNGVKVNSAAEAKRLVERETLKLLRKAVKEWPERSGT
jgi:hypothetical protein